MWAWHIVIFRDAKFMPMIFVTLCCYSCGFRVWYGSEVSGYGWVWVQILLPVHISTRNGMPLWYACDAARKRTTYRRVGVGTARWLVASLWTGCRWPDGWSCPPLPGACWAPNLPGNASDFPLRTNWEAKPGTGSAPGHKHGTSISCCRWTRATASCCSEWVSEQFLNGTSAHNRPFQCHYMVWRLKTKYT